MNHWNSTKFRSLWNIFRCISIFLREDNVYIVPLRIWKMFKLVQRLFDVQTTQICVYWNGLKNVYILKFWTLKFHDYFYFLVQLNGLILYRLVIHYLKKQLSKFIINLPIKENKNFQNYRLVIFRVRIFCFYYLRIQTTMKITKLFNL